MRVWKNKIENLKDNNCHNQSYNKLYKKFWWVVQVLNLRPAD